MEYISAGSLFYLLLLGVVMALGSLVGTLIALREGEKKLRYARLMPDVPHLYPPAHMGDSGYDLRISEGVILSPGSTLSAPTGLIVEIPVGYEGQVRGRSGLACEHIHTHFGTIDSTYRGQVRVILHNLSKIPFHFHKGDRIGQLVISKVEHPSIEEVDRTSMIPTERGDKGFGSTGNK